MLLTWQLSGGKTRGYSEIILEGDCLVKRGYPRGILGIFYQASGNVIGRQGYETLNRDSQTAEAEARRTRAAFVQAYGLRTPEVPLLRLDLERGAAPFILDEHDAG